MTRDEWQRAVLTAKMVALDNLKRLEKDPKDKIALEYFRSSEYRRWFVTPADTCIAGIVTYHRMPIAVAQSLEPMNIMHTQVEEHAAPLKFCQRCGEAIPTWRRKYCIHCAPIAKRERAMAAQRRLYARRKAVRQKERTVTSLLQALKDLQVRIAALIKELEKKE